MAVIRKWLDNPFWDNNEKTILKGILKKTDDVNATESTEVHTINKFDENGELSELYKELLTFVSEEKIDENTKQRKIDLVERREREKKREEDIKKSKKLEALFEAKLKAFEIEEVKNSTNRDLKTRLRRAKNEIEVNIYTMMIVMEELNKDEETED